MIEVRPARAGDAAAIRAVHEAAFPTIDEAAAYAPAFARLGDVA